MASDGYYWIVRLEVRESSLRRFVEERRVWIDGDPKEARDTAIAIAANESRHEIHACLSCCKEDR